MTSGGLSYLEAGAYIQVVSSSNGQITISTTGLPDGSGAANRVTFWSDSDTLSSHSGLTFDGTTLTGPAVIVNDGLTVNANVDITGDTISETTLNGKGVGSQAGAFLNIEDSTGDNKFTVITDDQTFESGTDVNLFISGTVGSRGTAIKGTSLFGGDVSISGSVFGNRRNSGGKQELSLVSDVVSFGRTNTNSFGSEVFFYVSGAAPSGGGPEPSVALFEGRLISSGNINVIQNYPATGSQLVLSNMTDTAFEGGSTKLQLRAGSSSGGSHFTFQKYGPNNVIASGGPHANVFQARSGSMVFMVGNPEETSKVGNQPFIMRDLSGGTFFMLTTGSVMGGDQLVYFLSGGAATSKSLVGSDTNFVVSGAIGSAGTSGANKGTALFGGDLVVSGGFTADGGTFHIDQANNRAGIGTKNPSGSLHIKTGDSGQPAPSSFADDLIIEGSESTGISILTPNNQVGRIYFGDNDNEQRGYVLYDHNLDVMKFSVANGNRMIIDQGGISGSLTKLIDGTSYIRAGSGITVASASNGSITISASGGGGGSALFKSGSTSVGSVTSIDVSRLGLLMDLGSNAIAITGTIGDPEDGSYADGLFTSFHSNTRIGHAIDKINEVLYYLSPSPAPNLSSIGTDGKTGTTALLSIGSSTGTGTTGYTVVSASAGLGSAVDANGSYTVVTASSNVRMGIFTGLQVITGDLADGVAQNAYTNGVINHSGSAFGDGEAGSLKLDINGSIVKTVDLTDPAVGAGNPGSGTASQLDGSSNGFILLSQTGSAVQSSGQPFGLFQNRTGKFQVHTGGGYQRKGWNYARVIHTVNSVDRTTNYIEWFVDTDGVNPKVGEAKVTNTVLSGSKFISGINYATGAQGEYRVRIDNFYDHVYAQNPITFTTTYTDSLATQTVPAVNTSLGALAYLAPVNVTASFDLAGASITAGTMASGSTTFNFSVSHPTKANMSTTGSVASKTFLVFSGASGATDQFEDFVYEDKRIISGAYDTNASVGAGSNAWNSVLHLTSSTPGQGDGLAYFAGKLKAPYKTTDNNGNFQVFGAGFGNDQGTGTNQPNYSNQNSGVKTYFRGFTNNSGDTVRDFDLFITGASTTIVQNSTGLDTGKIRVYAKRPGATGWLDLGRAFASPTETGQFQVQNGDGARIGTFNSSIAGDSPVVNHVSFGTGSIPDGEKIVLKIEADAQWAGHISGMNVKFPAVAVDAVSRAPELDELIITTPAAGVTGKLSFGSGKSLTDYINVTGSSSSNGGVAYGVGNNVNFNESYVLSNNVGSNKRHGILSSNGGAQTIIGVLNDDVAASGNSYSADSFRYAHTGTLALYVNQSGSLSDAVHSVNLATFAGTGDPGSGTGSSVNGNGSGFVNVSVPVPGKDGDGLPDFRYFYRTAKFRVNAADQNVKGWNWAKVVHHREGADDETTTFAEWVNDDDSNSINIPPMAFAESGSFGAASYYYQSGVKYFNTAVSPVASGTVCFRVDDAYTNVYSNSSTAVQFTTLTNFTAQSITISGSAVTDTKDDSLSSNGTSLPGLTPGGDITTEIFVTGAVRYTGGLSLPGGSAPWSSFTSRHGVATLTVDHPIDTNAVSSVTRSNFLAYSGSAGSSNVNTIEKFEGEFFRLQSGSFANQSASGSLGWVSSQSLVGADAGHNSGLLVYGFDGTNGYLSSPKVSGIPGNGNFNTSTTLTSPVGNVNYSSAAGTRYFVRPFKNNTTSDQAVVTLVIKGDATLVPATGTGSASLGANKNVHVYIKIPGKTGWLDVAKPANGALTDGSGALSGDRDATIDSGGASNEVTFSAAFLGGDPDSSNSGEHCILSIVADSAWTGYIKEISITY